jgi:hypothetical protein
MNGMAATTGGPSQRITESGSYATTLIAPTVRYASTNDSQFDPCMDWRAELWLGHLDIVDAPDVLGGYADYLTIRLGEHSIADMSRRATRSHLIRIEAPLNLHAGECRGGLLGAVKHTRAGELRTLRVAEGVPIREHVG